MLVSRYNTENTSHERKKNRLYQNINFYAANSTSRKKKNTTEWEKISISDSDKRVG